MAKIRISGTEVELTAESGVDLLEALQEFGYPIATSCGGRASCGLCRVTIVSGKEVLSPIGNEEVGHLGNVAKIIGLRLACQARIIADGEIIVDVPTVEDVEARKRQKSERIQRERALQRAVRTGLPAGASTFAGRDRTEGRSPVTDERAATPAATPMAPPTGPLPGPLTGPRGRPGGATPEHKSRDPGVRTEWRPRKLGPEKGGTDDR